MRNTILKLFVLIYLSPTVLSQDNNLEPKFFKMSVYGGVTRYLEGLENENWSRRVTLGYLEYGFGFTFHQMHEAGLKLGRNERVVRENFYTGYSTLTEVFFYEPIVWFSLYYRFSYSSGMQKLKWVL